MTLNRLLWIRRAFYLMSATGIVCGVAIALFSIFVLRPRLAAIVDTAGGVVRETDDLMSAAQHALHSASGTVSSWRVGAEVASVVPQALQDASGALRGVSSALTAGGHAARQTTEGVTGLVAPDKALRETNRAMQATSHHLRRLAVALDKLARHSKDLGPASARVSDAVAGTMGEMASPSGPLGKVTSRLSDLRRKVTGAGLPDDAMLLGLAVGVLLCLYGLIALFLALALRPDAVAGAMAPSRRAA